MTALFGLLLAAGLAVSGVVFDDANANGRRDPGERGLAGVVVSDGDRVVATGADGAYTLADVRARHVFAVTPGERRPTDGWFHPAAAHVDFALAPAPLPARWRFAHLSDPHAWSGNRDRLRRALALAARRAVDFGFVSGDLVRDALRADEATARAGYAAYREVADAAPFPLRPALGNHDVFGVERKYSRVPVTHPLYGKALYEEEQGPRYYAFDRGMVHFIVLDTIGVDDTWYFGLIDEAQLAWIRRELARVPPGTTVVTVGHIPLRSGALSLGYAAADLAQTLVHGRGQTAYRHLVRNADALVEVLKPYRWTLALQGHTHAVERLPASPGSLTRYHTAPAIDFRPEAHQPSGFFVYEVDGETVDDGELVTLE